MVNTPKNRFQLFFPLIFGTIVALMMVYEIGFLKFVPYPGFSFNPLTGTNITVFDPNQENIFRPGDMITKIGETSLDTYRKEYSANLWTGFSASELVEIDLTRDGEPKTVFWRFTGKTNAEYYDRLFKHVPLAIASLVLSLGFFFGIDPKNPNHRLLVSNHLVLALALVLTTTRRSQYLWYSPVLSTIVGWAIVPLVLHIGWRFPTPFKNMPDWIEKKFFPVIYAFGALGAVLDLAFFERKLLFTALVTSGFLFIVLMFLHYLKQIENRPRIHLVLRFLFVALIPEIVIIIFRGLNIEPGELVQYLILFSLPVSPTGFLFALWHGEYTHHQKRAGQFLSLYIFTLLIVLVSLSVANTLELFENNDKTIEVLSLIAAIGIVSSLGFNWFHRLIEKHLIGIPVELPQIIDSLNEILLNTQDTASISSLMGGLILPALHIRQSVLVEMQSEQVTRVIDMRGVLDEQIPSTEEIQQLVKLDQKILAPRSLRFIIPQKKWIRVILPLRFDQELIGVWMLGRRDPNDHYEEHVVRALENIAQQTTMAIINHQKTIHLRSLYEANINRNEIERANLARELHDDTLNSLALLQREFIDPKLSDSVYGIITSLRKTIQGLRPEMLSYGLTTALQDLADLMNERQQIPSVTVDIQGEPIALHRNTELHIFRIVQQACENAVEHAEATNIHIAGTISKASIHLCVTDNGIGMGKEMPLNLNTLMQNQHFGLAGMFERANIISAKLKVDSQPGQGTTITLKWSNHA